MGRKNQPSSFLLDLSVATVHRSLAGKRGQRRPTLPRSPATTTGTTETAATSTGATAIQELQLGGLTEGGCDKLRPQSRDSVVSGNLAKGDDPLTTGIPGEVAAVVGEDDDAAEDDVLDSDFLRVFDDEFGDGDISIDDDNVENTGLGDIAENITNDPSVEIGEGTSRFVRASSSSRQFYCCCHSVIRPRKTVVVGIPGVLLYVLKIDSMYCRKPLVEWSSG